MPEAMRTSRWVAECVGGTLNGPPDIAVAGVAALADAGPADVSFLGNPKYRSRVMPSRAGVVLVPSDYAEAPPAGRAWVVCRDPSAAFTRIVAAFAPAAPPVPAGVHPQAVIGAGVQLGTGVSIGPLAVVEPGATVGDGSVIGAGCYIGHDVRIGRDCRLYPHVSIRERCILGDRVIIHGGTIIGADGFGYTSGPQGHAKIPQVGIVQIDDDVEIGALAAVDRARFGRTWIQRGTKIDNLVQVAHNVVIGAHALVVGQAGIAGSARIGNGAVLAGQAAIGDHVTIGDRAIVMGQSGVSKDLAPGAVVFGTPAVDRREFARSQMNVKRLERLFDTVRELEAKVQDLQRRLGDPG